MLLKKKLNRSLTLLILLVALSFKSFSQNVTKDSTKIVLSKPVAKLVVKDLVSFDQITLQLSTTNKLLKETNLKLNTQSILVTNLESQVSNYDNIFTELNTKYSVQQRLSEDLERSLKRQKAMTTIYKIGTTVGAVATLLLLVK